MALSFLYRLVRRVVDFVLVHRMDDLAKDAEILLLRHQLAVLRRQASRPRFSWTDRALVATLARLVPRERWAAFLITPETILRWHRALVRRHWTYPHRRPGRPRLPADTVELILRLAREILLLSFGALEGTYARCSFTPGMRRDPCEFVLT